MRTKTAAPLPAASREERALGAVVDTYTHEKSGIVIRIRLDKSTMTFGAYVNGEQYTDKDGDALKDKIKDAVDASIKLEWIPLIEIEVSNPKEFSRTQHYYGSNRYVHVTEQGCTVKYSRFFVAHVDGGNWRRLEWEAGVDPKNGAQSKLSNSSAWSPPVPEKRMLRGYGSTAAEQRLATENYARALENWKPPYFERPDKNDRSQSRLTHTLAFSGELWGALDTIAKLLQNAQEELNKLLGSEKGIAAIAVPGAVVKLLGSGQ